MKKIAVLVILVIVFTVVFSGCDGKEKVDFQDLVALSIDDIKSDPFSYTGVIKINGVASAFSEDDLTFFSVMDTAELLVCRDLYCGAYAMPAKYIGSEPMPKLADVINMIGCFVETETGYYFEVTEFEVERNIKYLLRSTE